MRRKFSYSLMLPLVELSIWSMYVVAPVFLFYARVTMMQDHGIVKIRSGAIELTLPRDRWLTFSLVGVSEERFQLIANLNLPGALVGAPLLTPAASYLRLHPAVWPMRTWLTLTLPFFCLPVWWFVGRQLDHLLSRGHLHRAELAISALLCCGCLALLFGIVTAPPSDKPDLVGFLPGASLWAGLFGLIPVMWLLRRRGAHRTKLAQG